MRSWTALASSLALLGGAAFGAERVPVLAELFTSEGCSSCPPADELLARLHREQPLEGIEILVLGEHVDSWNGLGWADPFASRELTVRQRDYARTFHLRGPYTPQLVVDGRTELVGSDESTAREAIRRAAAAPKARLEIREEPETLLVEVSAISRAAPRGKIDLLLALVEDDLLSSVGGGENAGRALRHDAVVRDFRRVGSVGTGVDRATVAVSRPRPAPDWNRDRMRIVVFLQEREGRRVLGACARPLIGTAP